MLGISIMLSLSAKLALECSLFLHWHLFIVVFRLLICQVGEIVGGLSDLTTPTAGFFFLFYFLTSFFCFFQKKCTLYFSASYNTTILLHDFSFSLCFLLFFLQPLWTSLSKSQLGEWEEEVEDEKDEETQLFASCLAPFQGVWWHLTA